MGFKTIDQAAEAVRFYNHTFLDTSRIEVEVRLLNEALFLTLFQSSLC